MSYPTLCMKANWVFKDNVHPSRQLYYPLWYLCVSRNEYKWNNGQSYVDYQMTKIALSYSWYLCIFLILAKPAIIERNIIRKLRTLQNSCHWVYYFIWINLLTSNEKKWRLSDINRRPVWNDGWKTETLRCLKCSAEKAT